MTGQTVLTNGRIVLRDEVIDTTVVIRDGVLADISEGPSAVSGAVDLDGDFLIPGLVELHTDNLERHLSPRPAVRWPTAAGVIAHDAELAAAGITTVLNAVAIGDVERNSFRQEIHGISVEAIEKVQSTGMCRAEHFIHLRCEISAKDVIELLSRHIQNPLVRLVSIMDPPPGHRQWPDLEKYRGRSRRRLHLDDAEIDELIEFRQHEQAKWADPNRREIHHIVAEHALPAASHDDTTKVHVEEAAAGGVGISEFPTSEAAARHAHDQGMRIIMGAPNVVLGGSHAGNVSAERLAEEGLLDILSSDYAPSSMILAMFMLHDRLGLPLSDTVAMIATHPAEAIGFDDRGCIEQGRRGDLVQVRRTDHGPVVRSVWRGGLRTV